MKIKGLIKKAKVEISNEQEVRIVEILKSKQKEIKRMEQLLKQAKKDYDVFCERDIDSVDEDFIY